MSMNYSDNEIGEVLAILPGLLCDSRMFAAQIDEFHGAQVIDGFYAGCTTIAAMAAYALERLPARFALLGHSMGARVALEIVRSAPDRVTRLALANTGVHRVREGERQKRYALRDIGRANGIGALVSAWLPPMLTPGSRRNGALVETLEAMCVAAGQGGYEAQIEALLNRPALDDLLPRVRCPTLVIVGDADEWSPVDQHRAIAAAIPGAKLRIVTGAGHMLPVETPDPFNAELRDWLSWPATDPVQTKVNQTRREMRHE